MGLLFLWVGWRVIFFLIFRLNFNHIIIFAAVGLFLQGKTFEVINIVELHSLWTSSVVSK